jgi:hypothetical protein
MNFPSVSMLNVCLSSVKSVSLRRPCSGECGWWRVTGEWASQLQRLEKPIHLAEWPGLCNCLTIRHISTSYTHCLLSLPALLRKYMPRQWQCKHVCVLFNWLSSKMFPNLKLWQNNKEILNTYSYRGVRAKSVVGTSSCNLGWMGWELRNTEDSGAECTYCRHVLMS